MAMKVLAKFGRRVGWASPVVLVVVGFLAAIPWLKEQSDAFVLALSAAASIFVMGYAQFLTHRQQRHLDEVQIASQGFANSRGWNWGTMAGVVLLMLPPVANWLVDLANRLSTGAPDVSDRGAVHVALFLGLCLIVAIQGASVFVAALIWQRRMERP